MPRITYVENSGVRHTVEVALGESLMQGALNNGVPGIIAQCGGAAACATCRVVVDEACAIRLLPPEPLEDAMLDALDERQAYERLSCQIICTADLDGFTVAIPKSQS
jgi:ferredoxin, 2Fe-2S